MCAMQPKSCWLWIFLIFSRNILTKITGSVRRKSLKFLITNMIWKPTKNQLSEILWIWLSSVMISNTANLWGFIKLNMVKKLRALFSPTSIWTVIFRWRAEIAYRQPDVFEVYSVCHIYGACWKAWGTF